MSNPEMGGNPEVESIMAQIQALQEQLASETNPERAQQLQAQLMALVEKAQAMGIIK